jgi:hypothetical protein
MLPEKILPAFSMQKNPTTSCSQKNATDMLNLPIDGFKKNAGAPFDAITTGSQEICTGKIHGGVFFRHATLHSSGKVPYSLMTAGFSVVPLS